jgi:LAS superfamily LD-carboxypeptidase LdcB
LKTPVARPGFSNHQNGVAVDIQVNSSTSSPVYVWLKMNAKAYGFINTGASFKPPEFWHWEFRS